MKISVALAAYKGERFIFEQLASIAQQTVLPDEVIITDDSPDSATYDVVMKFKEASSLPISLHSNELRLGYKENFLKAISLCTGEVVAFCDQDDVWAPRKLEIMSAQFMDPDVMLVSHSVDLVDESLQPIEGARDRHWRYSGTYAPMSTDPWYLLYGMCAMARTVIFRCADLEKRPLDHTWPSDKMSHDEWAWMMGTALGKYVALPDKLALYRQHATNVVGAPKKLTTQKKILRSLTAGAEFYRFIGEMADQRAKTFDEVADGPLKGRALVAGKFYREAAVLARRRAELYDSSFSRWVSIRKLLEITFDRGYRSRLKAGLGIRAFVKDVYCSVLRR